MMPMFSFRCIDHVAIGVKCLSRSRNWYSNVLGFRLFRPQDPIFQADDISMICSKNGQTRIALLKMQNEEIGNLVKELKGGKEWTGLDSKSSSSLRSNHAVLWRNRVVQGHFALQLENDDDGDNKSIDGLQKRFEKFCDDLPGILESNGAETEDERWIVREDYGIQQSVFFKDPDLNEIEVCYWRGDPEDS